MNEDDPKRIARAWKRDVEFEIRRREARGQQGRWGIVVWIALGAVWLVLLFELFVALGRPRWLGG